MVKSRPSHETLRVANCSGFYGDRIEAAWEMVDGGPIDVLTGDYLAELTMMILHKDRLADPTLDYSFFEQVEGLEHPGFPLAEIEADGSFTVTKHPGTGGRVSIGTVTAQLLYEIDTPCYRNPDVTARFDTIRLHQQGPDRVRVEGVQGEPPSPTTKVCMNYFGGFKNSVTFLLSGLDIEAKAALAGHTLWSRLGGREQFADTEVTLHQSVAPTRLADACSFLTLAVKDPDPHRVGRRFSSAAVEMALASYPGLSFTAPPSRERSFGVYWPAVVSSAIIEQRVWFEGQTFDIANTPGTEPTSHLMGNAADTDADTIPTPPAGPSVSVPLGKICGARSGDKGGNANLGVWVRHDAEFSWLRDYLTVDRLRRLIPEARELEVDRYLLPNLRAINFVLRGLLGDGVAASLATDAQAKGLGEFLRAQRVNMPKELMPYDEESR